MSSILIVDDRPTNRQFLLTLLGYGGHRLLEAADGAEALALVRAERPDLVITDILMPAMDGYEFVQRLRAEPQIAATPVIFYSATYAVPEAQAMAKSCGINTVLPKPSDPQVILDAVNRELGLGEFARTGTSPDSQVHGASALHELHRIGDSMVAFLTDLRSTAQPGDPLTERIEQQFSEHERLLQLSAHFAENFSRLQYSSARLTALEELSLRLIAERRPQQIVVMFVEAAAGIVGATQVAVCMLEIGEEAIAHLAAKGVDAEALRPLALDRARFPGSLLQARNALRLDNAYASQGNIPACLSAARSFLGLPIRASNRLYGWMYFADKFGAVDFNEDDERIAAAMAAQIAVVYENATLSVSSQRHATQLQLAVTEREHAVAELRDSEQRFRQLAENIREIFFLATPGCTEIFYVSPAYEHIYGASCDSLYARPTSWIDPIHPDDRERAHGIFAQAAASGQFDSEFRIVRPDGGLRWIRARGFPIRDAAGGLYRVAGFAEDTTERKRLDEDRASDARRLAELSRRVVAVQEEEWRRIAGELHDSTSPNLSAVVLNLGMIAADVAQYARADLDTRLAEARTLLAEVMANIRDISADLRPATLDYAGLLCALEGYAELYSRRTGITVEVSCAQPDRRLAADMEAVLFRVAQEALTNCAKHADACAIKIELVHSGKETCMTIADNGAGFDSQALGRSDRRPGLGLLTMRERVEFVGGQFSVVSRQGYGTQVKVTV